MNLLWYLFTRTIMAVAALMCIDTITGTVYAAEPSSLAAAFVLIVITELLVAANVQDAQQQQQLTAADVIEAQQQTELRHHLNRLEDPDDES